MGKSRRPLIIPAFLLLVVAFASFTAVWFLGRFRIPDFLTPEKVTASWSVLEEIRDLRDLETAAYHMKVVFPFDFTQDRGVDWSFLKFHYDRNPDLFQAKTASARHSGERLPPEWKYAELYHLCRTVGIDPGRPDYRFVVISAVVTAGVDLNTWIGMFGSGTPEGGVPGIRIEELHNGGKTLEITSPPVDLITFTIEDRDASLEGFPDVPLSPERFRVLTDALAPELKEMALAGGLIEKARIGAQSFLVEIFTAAGYDEVRFSDS